MRTTIDFGIDLGTTNSAISVQQGLKSVLLEDADGEVLVPSVIHVAADGTISTGLAAMSRRMEDPANTTVEFKRLMGSDSTVSFPASGRRLNPEELSAEILKTLLTRAEERTGTRPEAAVVTIPAMFQLTQCASTRKAAQLAGIKEAPLLQEPIAAALAHSGSGTAGNGYWLVYDLGGGTFDVSLVRSKGGRLQVLDHDGDNHLGGKDLNRAVVRHAAEQVRAEGKLGTFGRTAPEFADAFTRLAVEAEQARIRLSAVTDTELKIEQLAQNEAGDWIGLQMNLDRDKLQALVRGTINRTTELCRKLLKRNQLSGSDLHAIVMVGGPTQTPFLPELLQTELGAEARHMGDPTTIVATGAALFASTQRIQSATMSKPMASSVDGLTLNLEYEAMTTNKRPLLVGRFPDDEAANLTVEISSEDGSYSSDRISVHENGAFSASLQLQDGQLNLFHVKAFRDGQPVAVAPSEFSIVHGLSMGKPPLSQSVGVALADNSARWYLRKGEPLPARHTVTHATTTSLTKGESGDAISVPLIQGESSRADRNKVIGVLTIHAEKVLRDLPAGAEVQVTLAVDEFSNTSASAYVPHLESWFDDVVSLQFEQGDVQQVERGLESQKDRLSELEKLAEEMDESEQTNVDSRFREVEELMEEGDADSVQLAEHLLRMATSEIDQFEDDAKMQKATADFDEQAKEALEIVTEYGNDVEKEQLDALILEFREAAESHDEKLAEEKREAIELLVRQVLYRTPGYWYGMLGHLIEQLQQLGLADMATGEIQEGVNAANREDVSTVISICQKLYERLPRDERADSPLASAISSITSNIQ